jgi:gamma-glutamyltranspeptidase / glutathione hydrolase
MAVARTLAAWAAAVLLAACAAPPQPPVPVPAPSPAPARAAAADDPEPAADYVPKPGWRTNRFAVAAANPQAVDAGYRMLKAGGTAVDAAVAVQMVLALTEPQSSGIGGGTLLLHYNGKDVEAFDGRETAPAAADENLFLGANGKPLAFQEAAVGGRSVGVPGTLRVLELAHQEYGKLPWAKLFEPAIALAQDGFDVSARLHSLIEFDARFLKTDPVAAAYFFGPDEQARPVGFKLRNPELAAVLRRIAKEGSDAFYKGEVAQAVVSKVQSHPTNPGRLTLADLAGYQAKKRAPICFDYPAQAHEYRVCGFPPPGSGAIAIGQILGMLSNTNAASLPLQGGGPSADWLHLYTEASRLAFADRAQYLGDPDFVQAPGGSWTSLLDPAYLAQRAKLIGAERMKSVQPGVPGAVKAAYAPSPLQPEYGTSNISIVDAQGNAIAMTTTVEYGFGSRQMVSVRGGPGGFLLNNELTDFSFVAADAQGRPVANRVQPGKRPRSSMSPTLVLDKRDGGFALSGGSAGGAVIIHYTGKLLYGVLNWGLDVQKAIDLPNFSTQGGPIVLEEKRFSRATVEALRAHGGDVREQPMTSGSQAIQKTTGGYFGGADPRREGIVMGD